MYYSMNDNFACVLHCSLPNNFPYDAACIMISPEICLISGGFKDAERNYMTDQCIALELTNLVGNEVASLPKPAALQTLLINKTKKEIYAVGGLQKIPMTQFEDVESEYCMGTFSVNRNDTWAELPQPSEALCIPTCYLIGQTIYAAGGFLHSQDEIQKYSNIQVFDINANLWSKLNIKFEISIFGSIAMPIAEDKILLLGGRVLLETPSNRIYVLKGGSAINNLEVAALELVPPYFMAEDRMFVFSEKAELLILNLNSLTTQIINVNSMIKSKADLTFVKKTFNLPRPGRFCYHYNAIEGEIYEMNVETLKREAYPLESPRFRDVGICYMNDGSLLFVGGIAVDTEFMEQHRLSRQCFLFDCLVKAKFPWHDLLQPQHGCRVLEHANLIFAFAGKSHDTLSSINQVFNQATKKWAILAPAPLMIWHPAVSELRGIFYMIGGETEDDEPTDKIQTYNHDTQTWKVLKVTLPIKACKLTSFVITSTASSEIIVIGGEGVEANAIERWYKFDGEEFKHSGNFIADDVMEFQDPPCISRQTVHIFSTSGRSYRLNILSNTWEEAEFDEVTEE